MHGRLAPRDEVERHTIACAEGTVLSVTVVSVKVPPAKSAAELRVRILDGDGNPLVVDAADGPGEADLTGTRVRFRKVAVPRSGTYEVEVSSADPSVPDPADYDLTVSLKVQKKWRSAGLAVTAAAPALFPFAAPEGASVRFRAKATGGVVPTFGRVLADATPTGTDFTGTAPAGAVFVAPDTGTFHLEVLGTGDAVVDASATVVAPKTRGRRIDATAFPGTEEGLLLTVGGDTPVEVAPDTPELEGLRIGIPAAAFPAGTILSVSPAPALVPVGAFTPAGPAISISASAAFAKGATVTLTLPFDAGAAGGNASSVAVTVRNDAGEISDTTTGLDVDLVAGTVSFPTSHFSVYQAVVAATPGVISTFAGNGTAVPGDGGPAVDAGLVNPIGVAVNGLGEVVIADEGAHVIRSVNALGRISTIAGVGVSGFTGDDGPASAARLNAPHTILLGDDGEIVFCDRFNHRLRRIDAAGTITTIAGNGTGTFAGDGLTATSASLNAPAGVFRDAAGNLFIADTFNHRIRRVDTSGTITTVAGNGTSTYGGDGIAATAASIGFPTGVTVNAAGDLFIADNGNHRIRKVTAIDGLITTIAGIGTPGYTGDGGPAIAARLNTPWGIVLDTDGTVLFTESSSSVVRRITASAGIETIIGNGSPGFSGDGGPATDAQLGSPRTIALDGVGRIYVGDHAGRVRRVTR